MVSIPDWARFSRLHDFQCSKSDSSTQLNNYYKKREHEAVRQAELNGYFVIPTREFLINTFSYQTKKEKRKIMDVKWLELVKLNGMHLKKLGHISYCFSLKICMLGNNYLQNIDGLGACRQLVKLDVHSNQLSQVPGMAFWSALRKLKFLYLHDNPLGKFETLNSLATCPHLIGLTLYDTPLSLRKNYRHHVVNSIWSLKALDFYVISDEEIIEEATFGGRFGTMNPTLKIDLSQPSFESNQSTVEQEMWCVRQVESRITWILTHSSPIHIIQRHLRGYFCRKHLKGSKKPHIQKTVKEPITAVIPPPPTSPITDATSSLHGDSGVPTDFDTYMMNRRPGSDKTPFSQKPQILPDTSPRPPDEDATNAQKMKKNLIINLSKLESYTFQSPQEDIAALERGTTFDLQETATTAKSRRRRRKKYEDQKPKRLMSIKHFFGPVVPSTNSDSDEQEETNEKEPVTNFRLRGTNPSIFLVDPMTEMILERREVGKAIRDAEYDNQRIYLEKYVNPLIPRKPFPRIDQRVHSKIHGTMGMSCFWAVQKAYKEREKAEKNVAKMERIFNMRQERNRAKERIQFYHEERRNIVQKKRDDDRAQMLDALEKHDLERINYLDKRQEFKIRSADVIKSLQADNTFVSEFSNQHTSVSNALLRHDRQARNEDQTQAKISFVRKKKRDETEHLETVKKFLEHRQLVRQSERSALKTELATKMIQEANEKMMQARTRVEQMKARQANIQAYYPLPPRELQPLPAQNDGLMLSPDTRRKTMTI